MTSDADFKAAFAAVAEAALSRADELLKAWLPGGKREALEYKCGDLDGSAGRSLSVNVKSGVWKDFNSGEGGPDLVALYAAIEGLKPWDACKALAEQLGVTLPGQRAGRAAAPPVQTPARPAPAPKPAEREGWRSVVPVPANAAPVNFRHHHRSEAEIQRTAEYWIGDDFYGYVVRFRTSDGGKDDLPRTYCMSPIDGACKWHWKTWDEPRPLYLPGRQLPGGRTVLLVEGEKCADVLHALLEAAAPGVYCVASWPGGCKSWQKANWALLAGAAVIAWPDCDAKREPLTADERKANPDKAAQAVIQQGKPLLATDKQPGMAAMRGIGALLQAQGCTVQLLPIPAPGQAPDGWDCADAIDVDGWDAERVREFLQRAYAMPGAGAAPPAAPPPPRDGPAGAEDGGSRRELHWWLRPYWDADKCRWMVSRKLVIAALTHDEDLAGMLGLNELSNNIDSRRARPWGAGVAGPITGADDLLLGQYLSDTYGLPSIPRAALSEAIETVAHGRRFHPIRNYLETLAWDGKARVDKWLIYAIGETPDSLDPAIFEYLTLVGRYWLLGMVNRVMTPGCKFDYCPVLEGKGGMGKSTLVEMLATTPFYSDTHFDVSRGKEGQEQVQGLWLYEIAELQQFGKAEIQLIKAFVSAKVDRYRPSYGRVVESFPRQCVLVGTTNERTYLRDRTGNRRFWPVPVRHRINIPWVERSRDQLLAEAFTLFQAGARFYPTHEDEERLFVPMQEARLVETAVHSKLLDVLTRPPMAAGIGALVNELTEFVTLAQLTEALGVDAAKSSSALEGQIRAWLEHQEWQYGKKRAPRGLPRPMGYYRPKVWPPEADQGDDDEETTGESAAKPRVPVTEGADDEPF